LHALIQTGLIQTKKNYFIASREPAAGLIPDYACDGVRWQRCRRAMG
jgi:hypothetical protein